MGTFAQTQLIPANELSPGGASSIRNGVMRSLLGQASKDLPMIEEKLVVRDIRPLSDLDYTIESWGEVTGATANTYETMSTGTLADRRFLAIYGVKLSKESMGSCSAIRITIGGSLKAIWVTEGLSKIDDYIGFCPSGIIIPQNTIYTIERYVIMTTSPFNCILKGLIVEPRGKVVSP